jgi:hypothetical protein
MIPDGKDAGIESNPVPRQDRQCPQRPPCDREIRRPITANWTVDYVLEDIDGPHEITFERRRFLGIDKAVFGAVAGDVVSRLVNCANQFRMSLGDPAQNEKGCPGASRGQNLQDAAGGGNDPVFVLRPTIWIGIERMKPILDIDGHRIQHGVFRQPFVGQTKPQFYSCNDQEDNQFAGPEMPHFASRARTCG